MPTIIMCHSEEQFITESETLLENATTIALSGGSTPKELYKKIANRPAAFYQVDERYVPADHPDSNQNMIAETGITLKAAFNTALPIEECLQDYASKLPEAFDVCILGMGNDGHTASLFPHTETEEKKVAHTTTDEFAIHDRLTITFPLIMQSKSLILLLKNKQEAFDELLHGTKSETEFPAKKLLKHADLTIITLSSEHNM